MSLSTLAAIAFAALVTGGVLGVVVDAFGSRKIAVACVAAGLVVASGVFVHVSASTAHDGKTATTVWGVLHFGGMFASVGAVIAALAAVAVLGGWNELTRRDWGGSLAGLMGLGAAASIVVALSTDVTLLLIGLETAAACGYVLVASGGRPGSREAALKYFVQGAIATGFFLFGMAVLVTAFLPTGNLDALSTGLQQGIPQSVVSAALVLLIGALAFKAGAAPFHSWVPDAYESSAPSSAAFLASGPKIGAVVALTVLAVQAIAGGFDTPLVVVISLLAVLSILVGSITALRQRSYTRMLGYAGVAQVGYALVAVAMAQRPTYSLFFIACYAIASAGTFLAAGAFRQVRPEWDGTIEGLAGMSRQAPVLALSTSVLLISLAGIPPLLGFWAKFGVFVAAFVSAASSFHDGKLLVAWVSVTAATAGIIGSAVSLAYYGSVLRALYQQPAINSEDAVHVEAGADDEPVPAASKGYSARVAVAVLAVVVVVVGVLPLLTGVSVLWSYFA